MKVGLIMVSFEIFKIAIQNIFANKMRSALTMLGLVIGIQAVVIITTLGNAAQADMTGAFDQYGKGKMNINLSSAERPIVYRDFFSDLDVQAVESLEEIEAASAEIRRRVSLKYKNKVITSDLYGVNNNYDEVETVQIIKGRFLQESDIKGRRNVIIIDEKSAVALFGTIDAIGEVITMTTGTQTMDLMVIGVDKLSDSTILNMAMGDYFYSYIPLTLASRFYYVDRYPRLMIQAQEMLQMDNVATKILSLLERRYKEAAMYRIVKRETEFNQVSQGLTFLTATISGIAAISLLVGGIGIMNIMLVSVTERTREIGIRKAIGAKSSNILLQFLMEAVILSIFGGLLGLTIGGAIGFGIVKALKLPFIISVNAVLYAFLFSLVVGIVFGVYPARKAAKLDPIDALRYE